MPPERQIIVVGKNDMDQMQDHMPWPGKDAAIGTAENLAEELNRQIH